jgi:hypothetical protein
MAYLINRNPSARAECLHALCGLIHNSFGEGKKFTLNEIKFNPNTENIHDHCNNLIVNKDLERTYCRYKQNPLDKSACSLTNSQSHDTTKSKEVSNTINSLHNLGLVCREHGNTYLTELGTKFALSKINTKDFSDIFRRACLNSGLMVGFLGYIFNLNKTNFETKDIYVGYPNPKEKVEHNGHNVEISSGSTNDSNTRTKSCLLAWGVTAEFFAPENFYLSKKWDDESLKEYVLSEKRNLRRYKLRKFPYEIFSKHFETKKPLDYKNLTKGTGALRENNQKVIRETTLFFERKIQNRRAAIVLTLDKCYRDKKNLNFKRFINFLSRHDEFVVNPDAFERVMQEEIKIAFMAGCPIQILGEEIKPLTCVNKQELMSSLEGRSIINILRSYEN